MPLPLAHAIVGASVVVLCRPGLQARQDWKAVALGATIAVLPDFDFFLNWFGNLEGNWHRGFTHSILFGLVIGASVAVLAGNEFWKDGPIYSAAALSHGLLDAITTRAQGGVELFWPLSSNRIRLGLFDYPFFFAPDPNSQSWSFIFESLVRLSLPEGLIFGPILVVSIWFRYKLRQDQL